MAAKTNHNYFSPSAKISSEDKQWVSHIINLARINLETDGTLAPVAVLGNSLTKSVRFILLDFKSEEEKYLSSLALRKMVTDLKSNLVLTIFESYFLGEESALDYQKNHLKYRSVSSHPNAKEGVLFSLETRIQSLTAIVEIKKTHSTPSKKTFGSFKFEERETSGILANFISSKHVLN